MGQKDNSDSPDFDGLLEKLHEQKIQQRAAAQRARAQGDEDAANAAQVQSDHAARIEEQLRSQKNGGCFKVVAGLASAGAGALIATLAGDEVEATETVPPAPPQTIHSTIATTTAPPSRMIIAPEPRTTSFPAAIFPAGSRQWADQPLGPRTARSIR